MIPPLGFRIFNLFRQGSLRSHRHSTPPLLLTPIRSLSFGGGNGGVFHESTRGRDNDSPSIHSTEDHNDNSNYSLRDRDRRKMYNNSNRTGCRDGPRSDADRRRRERGGRDGIRFDESRFGGNYERNQFSRKEREEERGYGEIDGRGFRTRRGEGIDSPPFDKFHNDEKIGKIDFLEKSQFKFDQDGNSNTSHGRGPYNDIERKGFKREGFLPFDEFPDEEKIGGSNKRNQAPQGKKLQDGNSFLEKFKLGFDKDEKKIEQNLKPEEIQKEADEGPPQEADVIFKKMKETGLIPNTVAMLDGLCKDGLVQEAMKLFGLMREKGTIPEVVIYTAVVDGFCNAQKLNDAVRIFRKMQSNGILPNAFSYSVLIQGLCKGKRLEDALEICLEMVENGHSPNLVTFVGLVDGFCQDRGLEEGKSVIVTFREKGFFCDEKGVRQYLDKKGPSRPLVWEAFFGKSTLHGTF